jgi:hypothetical protein
MVAKSKATRAKGQTKKLKLKRETIRDLKVTRVSQVKGGGGTQGNVTTNWNLVATKVHA